MDPKHSPKTLAISPHRLLIFNRKQTMKYTISDSKLWLEESRIKGRGEERNGERK